MMKSRKHIVRSGLSVVVFLVAGLGCSPSEEPSPVISVKPPLKLTIISPHSERIRSAFAKEFSDWYDEKYGRLVQIDWIVRGTPQCLAYIEDLFSGRDFGRSLKTPDIMFGGGISYHAALAKQGRTFKLDLGDAVSGMPADVRGIPTRDAEDQWVATGLSSFGILFNSADCAKRDIEVPKTWTELADPRFAGWLAIANPAVSGSYRQSMMLILQQQGWDEGWGTLVRILANARALDPGSTRAHDQIETGTMLAGFAVNFDGLRRVQDHPSTLRYVNPAGATAATPDIVSVLKTATDTRLAEQFVRFCLSQKGQATWCVTASGRPGAKYSLHHYPIKPKLYETYAGKMGVDDNPFETDFGIKVDRALAVKQAVVLVPLTQAICGENHVLLQKAWAAIQSAGMNQAALAELCKPIVDEQDAYAKASLFQKPESAEALKIEREWSDLFRAKLDRVIALAQG